MLYSVEDKSRNWEKDFSSFLQENKTLVHMVLKNAEKFSSFDALTDKVKGQWISIKWKEFAEMIKAVAKGLLELNILQPGEMGGIFAFNRMEWAIADLGILAIRGVSVPIYATNSAEEAAYIIEDAGIKVLFVGNQEQYERAKKAKENSNFLQKIIAFDRDIIVSDSDSMYFDELIELGKKSRQDKELQERLNSAHPDDILTLIYTSGTTGNPKGAIHSHRSFLTGIFAARTRFLYTGPQYVSLAVLPLSHVFERMWSYGCMSTGVRIAYCSDPKQFLEAMVAVRPHFMTSVPRIWEKVYGTINEGLKNASPVKVKLFNWAKKTALQKYHNDLAGKNSSLGLKLNYALADRLIMQKVRKTLGAERCDVYHAGGAALAPEINEFFCSFGINIIQGYGLTEFFPVCVGFDKTGKPGICGPMIPMCQARISEEGEIQLKGGMCMLGYHKKPEETAACFTEDGWFKTQDIGSISFEEKNGETFNYITITDRIKDIIITAGGKNISPQQIEMLFGDEPLIEQFVTIGEGRKFISALIVPNFIMLEEYCQKNNIPFTSREEIVNNPQIIKLYEEIIEKRTECLGQVEKIKKFTLLTRELTQEAGELTPTLKLKRKKINEKYREIIDKMYEE